MKFAYVEDEYKKHKELHADDLKSLQAWIQKQPHIPPVSGRDLQLAIFLHSCYWSMEQAKITIDKYMTYRSAWPDFFANRNPNDPALKIPMEVALCTFLTIRDNYKFCYFKLMDLNVDKFNCKDCIKLFDMCLALEFMQKGTFDGFVIICDLREATVAHALKIDIMSTKRIMLYLQEALPVRLKGFHIITARGITNLIVPLFKPFMKKELSSLLHFHDSYEALCKLVPQEVLPADFDGKIPTTKELHANMHKSFTENADFFVEQERQVSNETLRDLRPSYMDQDLGIGIGGSFKKLDID